MARTGEIEASVRHNRERPSLGRNIPGVARVKRDSWGCKLCR